jgi:hypothetical protein
VAISFIPKDPLSPVPTVVHEQDPRPDRAAAGFTYFDRADAQGPHQPYSKEFLFWQCREAALAAVETWERLDTALARWSERAADPAKLDLVPNRGSRLDAYYDRTGLTFYAYDHAPDAPKTYSGASADVVTHETGHALLDAVRPELWQHPFTEIDAFHESFGDCISLLTALANPRVRALVLAESPTLRTPNFVERWGATLADGVKRSLGPTHQSAEPRHALNDFAYQLPTSLKPAGLPAELTGEFHSFSRVFTGCFYDTLCNMFADRPRRDEADLAQAAETAGRLLLAAARAAPATPAFFQAVGRAMVLADEQQNQKANQLRIRAAFANHNIPLGTPDMLTPKAALAGAAPRPAAAGRAVRFDPGARKDLLDRIAARPEARLVVRALDLFGRRVVEALHLRAVPLGKLHRRLRGVFALAPECVLIGSSGSQAAVLGGLPEENATIEEVNGYVTTLLEHDRIDFGSAAGPPDVTATHTVAEEDGKKVLARVRFFCRGGA